MDGNGDTSSKILACEVKQSEAFNGSINSCKVSTPQQQTHQSYQTSRFSLIEEIISENILLRKQLAEKLEELKKLEDEIENRTLLQQNEHSEDPTYLMKSFRHEEVQMEIFSSTKIEGCTQEFPTLNLTQWMNLEGEERNRFLRKVTAVRDLAIGGSAGFGSAFLLRKFGMFALTAISSGVAVVYCANKTGLVVINWKAIYDKFQNPYVSPILSDDHPEEDKDEHWIVKFQKLANDWSSNNRNLSMGFLFGFLYKSFF